LFSSVDALDDTIKHLIIRGINHDKSKLSKIETKTFIKYQGTLKTLKFGSKEYTYYLDKLKPALEHHYSKCSHHPQHFTNGVYGMSNIDLIEMICDWFASCKRNNGDIMKSLEFCSKRFNITGNLYKTLKNTIETMM
jgi:hypothetical protein